MATWMGRDDIEAAPLLPNRSIENDADGTPEVLVHSHHDGPGALGDGHNQIPEVVVGIQNYGQNAGDERPEIQEVVVDNRQQDLDKLAGIDRTLPEGKRYHLFFSYSSEDDDYNFVKERIKVLENPPFNLKCCVDKRDFISGMSIEENINVCMSQSMKIILVLSPSFVESGWCNYEQRIAQALSVADRTYSVIPIKYKPCQIPDSLKILNYVDMDDKNGIDDKITKSLLAKAGPENILPNGFLNWYGQQDVNGGKVMIAALPGSTLGYSKFSWVFPPLTTEQKRELREIGVKMDPEDLKHVTDKLNKHWALRFHGFMPLTAAGCLHTCGIVTLLLLLGVSVIGIACISRGIDDNFCFAIGFWSFVIAGVLISCCSVANRMCWRTQAYNSINKVLAETNLPTFRTNKAIFSFSVDNDPKLFVVYYNTEECEKFIQCLTKRKLQMAEGEDNDLDETILNERTAKTARAKIDTLVTSQFQRFSKWALLPDATYARHPTLQNKMCLCQLYQSIIARE